MSGSTTRRIWRFVGLDEVAALRKVRTAVAHEPLKVGAMTRRVRDKLVNLLNTSGAGARIYDHTMAKDSGGGFLGGQQLIAFTGDYNALAKSTDGAVQLIVKNAPYLVEFVVPRDAVIGAASNLSTSEEECVGVNDLAFGALLVKVSINPFLGEQKKERATSEYLKWIGGTELTE